MIYSESPWFEILTGFILKMESKGVERDLREGISKARKGSRQAPFTSLPLFVGAAFTIQQMLCASFRKGPEREGEHLGIHPSHDLA